MTQGALFGNLSGRQDIVVGRSPRRLMCSLQLPDVAVPASGIHEPCDLPASRGDPGRLRLRDAANIREGTKVLRQA